MPRVRSRRAHSARDPLGDVPLALELEARCAPGTLPAIDAMIRAAEHERPSMIGAQWCRMAVDKAERGDPAGALQKLRRAREIRSTTPPGGFLAPTDWTHYLAQTEEIE